MTNLIRQVIYEATDRFVNLEQCRKYSKYKEELVEVVEKLNNEFEKKLKS